MSPTSRPVEALARGLKLLEALSRAESGTMTNSQLVRSTGLTPSTVSRLASTLMELGYLRTDPLSGAYALTPKNLRLGYSVLANMPFIGRTQAELADLTEATGLTSALAVPDGVHATFVSTAQARGTDAVPLAVGGRLPLSSTATGWCLLANLRGPADGQALAAVENDMRQRGTDPAALRRTLEAIDPRLVRSHGTWKQDFVGFAAPVKSGREIYALTLIGTAHAGFDEETVVAHVLRTAERITD